MRLIDADALLEKLRKTDRYFMLKFDIESAPTVIPEDFMNPYEEGYERAKKDFERPQGKWNVISLLDDYVYLHCSECGQSTRLVRDAKNEFCCIKDVRDKIIACPNCGAKMKGAEE